MQSHLKDLNKVWPVIWKATPESGRLPGREGYMNMAHKQIVTIVFSPHEPITYKQNVWIEVYRGRGCRLVKVNGNITSFVVIGVVHINYVCAKL